MNFIKELVNKLITKIITNQKPILGRWNIEKCDLKTNFKIDLSNEDHCGPCGQYLLDKNKKIKIYNQLKLNNYHLSQKKFSNN